MGLRRRAREAALKILYQIEMSGYSAEECIDSYWNTLGDNQDIKDFTNFLVRGVNSFLSTIDDKINKTSVNWKIDRMHKVDLSILRLAVFEMFYTTETPYKVIINEAVELAKKYGTDNSPSFINGILDKIAEQYKKNEKYQ
ncbi:MAG: transcription antitermination factor NusB [Proteobacteria bacterium]|nr:transcription antitermination factor NusB [Pseudomonadota bacterium]